MSDFQHLLWFIAPDNDDKALVFVPLGVLQRGLHWLDRVAGVMFIGFGLKLALTDNPTH